MSFVCANSKYDCLYDTDKLILVNKPRSILVQMSNIKLVELDQFILDNIYIVKSNEFMVGKYKISFSINNIYKFNQPIFKIVFSKFLYFKSSYNLYSFYFIINDKLYSPDNNEKLNSIEFDNNIVEAFVSSDKKINELIYILDAANNFYSISISDFKVIKNTNLMQIDFFGIKIEDKIKFLLIENGAIFLIDGIKSCNFLVKKECLENFQKKTSNPAKNFISLKEDGMLKICNENKIFSVSSSKLSCLIFSKNTNIYILTYYNGIKKINLFEIKVGQNFNHVHAIVKNKKLRISILLDNYVQWIFKLDHKKNFFITVLEKPDEIIVDFQKAIITIYDHIKKYQTNIPIMNDFFYNKYNTTNLNELNFENLYLIFNEEEKLKFKHETIEYCKNIIINHDENISETICKFLELKLELFIIENNLKLEMALDFYSKEIEKSLYEENLLNKKLNQLIVFYTKN